MFSSAFKNQVVNLLNSVLSVLSAIQATLKTMTTTMSGITATLAAQTKTLSAIQNTLATNQEKIMSGLDDLNAAAVALEAEQLQVLADFQTLLTQNQGDSDAAVEAIAQRINASVAAIQAGDPVPPVAPPAPSA